MLSCVIRGLTCNDMMSLVLCALCAFEFLLFTGCKESWFYGLPFGQVVSSVC